MIIDFNTPAKVGSATVYNVTPVRGGDSFLFVYDDVTFIIDSGFGFSSKKLHENIVKVLGNRPLDYVLLTHSHYDHALGSATLSSAYPELKVVGHEYAAKVMLKEGARKTMTRLDEAARELNGFTDVFEHMDNLHIDIAVTDKDVLTLGSHKCEIVALPGHTRDTIAYYFEDEKLMLGCETVGLFADEGVVLPSFLVGYQLTLDSIEHCATYDIEHYMIPHQGLVEGQDFEDFMKASRLSHRESADLIISAYKDGKTTEDIIELFAAKYYPEFVQKIYPPTAFAENINIQIPMILREHGLIE